MAEPFQGSIFLLVVFPGLSLRSNPWAGFSERLRRNFKLMLYPQVSCNAKVEQPIHEA